MPSVVDHDLHGLLTVRLIDPPPAVASSVARQLGVPGAPVDGDAELVVRFVDAVERRGRLRLIGLEEAGFTDDAFLLLRTTGTGRALAAVPFDALGGVCEIQCERTIDNVPMLIPLLNLLMLAKGVLPLHASAFTYGGTGIVAAGWRKSGKTEALLGFTAHGAVAVADEWCYVTADRSLYGIAEPVRLQDWHLAQLPQHRDSVGAPARARLRALGGLDVVGEAARAAARRKVPGARAVGRALRAVHDRRHVDLDPRALFGAGGWAGRGHLDRVFLLLNSDDSDVCVQPISSKDAADRMVFAHQHHRLNVIGAHLTARFAFPDHVSETILQAEGRERSLLRAAFEGLPCFSVEHPYPVPIEATFRAMQAHCG